MVHPFLCPARRALPTCLPSMVPTVEQVAAAAQLGIVNGSRPVLGWTWFSARRGSYGVRFFPVGAPAVVQVLDGATFVPAADPCA